MSEKYQVKAKSVGFHGLSIKKEGDVFELEHAGQFSPEWMEDVNGTIPESKGSKVQAKPVPKSLKPMAKNKPEPEASMGSPI